MLEKLISRELKAITYFGAFLGIFSALFIYLLRINMGVSSFWQLPVSILVYGAIGYITNVIAIKMIFRPYEKKKLLGLPCLLLLELSVKKKTGLPFLLVTLLTGNSLMQGQ